MKLTFFCCFDELAGLLEQAVHDFNTGVEVVFDFVEIAIIFVGDFLRYVALADTVDVFGGNVNGSDECIYQAIDAGNEFFKVSLEFRGIASRIEFTFSGCFDEVIDFAQSVFLICLVEDNFHTAAGFTVIVEDCTAACGDGDFVSGSCLCSGFSDNVLPGPHAVFDGAVACSAQRCFAEVCTSHFSNDFIATISHGLESSVADLLNDEVAVCNKHSGGHGGDNSFEAHFISGLFARFVVFFLISHNLSSLQNYFYLPLIVRNTC